MNGIFCVIFPRNLLVGKSEKKRIIDEKRERGAAAARKAAQKAARKAAQKADAES